MRYTGPIGIDIDIRNVPSGRTQSFCTHIRGPALSARRALKPFACIAAACQLIDQNIVSTDRKPQLHTAVMTNTGRRNPGALEWYWDVCCASTVP